MTKDEVQAAILEELARLTNTEPDVLMAQLTAGGEQWPCDSLVLAEVVVVLEERLSVQLPMDDTTATSLRTVKGLADRILGLVGEVGASA